jgi:hypothetical protein
MYRKTLLAAAAALSLMGLGFAAPQAQASEWKLLGTQSVNYGNDRDTIMVGFDEGRFTKVRLHVRNNNLHITDLKVVFMNGEVQHLPVQTHIHAGQWSQVLDLSGDARVIQRIDLSYRTEPWMRHNVVNRAVVEVYGLTADWGGGGGYDPGHHHGWKLLGTERVSTGVEKDTIDVGGGQGRFTSLRVRVHDQPVHFYGLVVTFRNGQIQDVAVPADVAAGSRTAELDLSGDERTITKIDLVYRAKSDFFSGFHQQARVEVWGKH